MCPGDTHHTVETLENTRRTPSESTDTNTGMWTRTRGVQIKHLCHSDSLFAFLWRTAACWWAKQTVNRHLPQPLGKCGENRGWSLERKIPIKMTFMNWTARVISLRLVGLISKIYNTNTKYAQYTPCTESQNIRQRHGMDFKRRVPFGMWPDPPTFPFPSPSMSSLRRAVDYSARWQLFGMQKPHLPQPASSMRFLTKPGKARRNPRKCENNLNNFPNIFARARATLFSWMIMSQCAGK